MRQLYGVDTPYTSTRSVASPPSTRSVDALRADNTTTGMRELTGGEIVGIVVGSVLLILTIVLSVYLVRCHKASKATGAA